ncbi:MAG: hypothetical protein ACRDDY_01710 [Clostridium sp.]|uniref:hypothetical protein n=1 Tax=Clostridium sp. TaxID=1506 RepID=UPI003EE708BA
MNEKLLSVITEIFPTFNPYIAERVRESIIETSKSRIQDVYIESPKTQDILQGDIFEDVEFLFYNNEGEIKKIKTDAIVISNTCDISRNKKLIFAPFIPIKKLAENSDLEALKKNIIFNKFYIKEFEEKIIDFDSIINIPQKKFSEMLTKRKYSLTRYGFYMLLIKLSVYLMRVESDEVKRN